MKCSLSSRWMLVLLLAACARENNAVCLVSMNGGLPVPQPLILTPGGRPDVLGFKLPSPEGELTFTSGEEVRLVCAGDGNSFTNLNSDLTDITVSCNSGTVFNHDGEQREFNFFNCSNVPLSTTRRSQTRCNNNKNNIVEIGFEVKPAKFYKVIDVCFDSRKLNNIWSRSHVLSVIEGDEDGFTPSSTSLTADTLFASVDPEKLYNKQTQKNNIGRIIGNVQASRYINSTSFLAQGLLCNSDIFLYSSQKLAALNFMNVAPQWEKLRVGMWRIVENRIRYYANVRGVDLVVYSGTHGVTTLPDVSKAQNERELYLSIKDRLKQVAVPAIFWKVVYDPVSKRGVALVVINNPHKNRTAVELDARYEVCATKRYITTWHVCASSNRQLGFGYCCQVDDFRNFVKTLPHFQVTDILS